VILGEAGCWWEDVVLGDTGHQPAGQGMVGQRRGTIDRGGGTGMDCRLFLAGVGVAGREGHPLSEKL
jgi:hypothetical protein